METIKGHTFAVLLGFRFIAARLGLTTGALGGIVTANAGAALVITGLRVVGVFRVPDPDPL